MKQREVQGADGVMWSCVQALSGLSDTAADEAEDRLVSADGSVPVVCTPRGGERTIRLELPREWIEQMGDAELLAVIEEARDERDGT